MKHYQFPQTVTSEEKDLTITILSNYSRFNRKTE